MKRFPLTSRIVLPLLGLAAGAALASDTAPKPVYSNDFEAETVDAAPKGFLLMAGEFAVKADGANKVLELPGEPLDSFGLLFGPSMPEGGRAAARFFGTGKGRKFPTFGISLAGAGGYRLQVSPGKKALEIYKGDESRASVPFEWASGTWMRLCIQIRKTPAGTWRIEGKAWPSEANEPGAWTISLEEKEAPATGRPGLWGSPYSGTPIRYDDVRLENVAP